MSQPSCMMILLSPKTEYIDPLRHTSYIPILILLLRYTWITFGFGTIQFEFGRFLIDQSSETRNKLYWIRSGLVAVSSIYSSLSWAGNLWKSHMDRNWCRSERVKTSFQIRLHTFSRSSSPHFRPIQPSHYHIYFYLSGYFINSQFTPICRESMNSPHD